MPTGTTNYNWQKPDVGASIDAWGGLLNTDLDGIDSTVKTVSNVANAALPSATASTTYVAKAGDTMTGALTVTPASGITPQITINATGIGSNLILNRPATFNNNIFGQTAGSNRWNLIFGNSTAEAAGNVGSDFQLNASDNTGTLMSIPLIIERKTGYVTASGNGATLPVASITAAAHSSLRLNKGGSGNISQVVGMNNGLLRWALAMGDATSESGSNVGSDLAITSWNDAGNVQIGTPFSINRATGTATFNNQLTCNNAILVNGPASANRPIIGCTSGVGRWSVLLGNGGTEPGSNNGSDFFIQRYSDAGVVIDNPFTIIRSTGNVVSVAQITAGTNFYPTQGYLTKAGVSAGSGGFRFNYFWTSSVLQAWIDTTNIGNVSLSSDYRIKKDVADLPSMWERAKALRPISYTLQEYTPPAPPASEQTPASGGVEQPVAPAPLVVADDIERWGFIAHELQETLIMDAATGEKDSPTHIQSPNPWTVIATLTKALQEAMARIEALEAARG